MRFTAILQLPKFDRAAYGRKLHQVLSGAIEDAARVWLNATVTALISIWSGASAATFIRLARAAQYGLPVSPIGGAPDRTALGMARSDGVINYDVDQYTFEYGTTLKHLVFNEFNNANTTHDPAVFSRLVNPGPYQFQRAGQAAFREFARKVRLPNPFEYVKVTTRQVS